MPVVNIQDFLAAVKSRYDSQGLASVPVSQGKPSERTPRPYCVVDTVAQASGPRTNQSRIDIYRFSIHAYHDTPEDAGTLAARVETALLFAPLTLSNATVLTVMRPTVRYLEEDYRHKAVLDFAAQVKQTVNSSPA